MTKNTQERKSSSVQHGGDVADLSHYRPIAASRQRVRRIKEWHAAQHMRDDMEPAAVVCVTLDAGGRLHATALGLEPELRSHLAAELIRLARELCPSARAA